MLSVEKIHQIIKENTPDGTFILVRERKALGGEYTQIYFAVSETMIDAVHRPQDVSFSYDQSELIIQIYEGAGGQNLTIDPTNPMWAYSSVKVPFRTVKNKGNMEKYDLSVERALVKFCQKWVELMKENVDVLSFRQKTTEDKNDPKKIDYRSYLGLS